MKKASYRLLQWTMLMGTAALMATACVVTTDDDGEDGIFDGGEGGTSSTAGKGGSTAGKGGSTTAGTSSGGTTGGSTTGGSTTGGSAMGGGGSGSSYVPGLCQVDEPEATSLPSCAPSSNDEGQTCKICLKASCCEAWQTCYGDTPTTACGWGETEDAPGQFDCIQNCYLDTPNGADDLAGTLQDCEKKCLNQCEDKDLDGFALTDTTTLLGCAQDSCLDECFPAQ